MKIKTVYDQKPIPSRNHDWCAYDDDTYCCEGCHSPIGHGSTEQEAIANLMEKLNG